MRDDGKQQLKIIDQKIKKAKNSLGEMENLDTIKTLEMEFVDIIPLGQFPADEEVKEHN